MPKLPVLTPGLRPLNTPQPLHVQADDRGTPLQVQRRRDLRPREVLDIQDRWRIDDEWWRAQPISRLYFTLLLEGDLTLTVYHDLVDDLWHEQRDAGAG